MTSIDRAAFEELKQISGDEFINELIDTFLEDASHLLEELKTANATGNADTFRRAAHSLKSNAATFGASAVAEMAKDLESIGRENRLGDTGNRLIVLNDALASACDELRGLKS